LRIIAEAVEEDYGCGRGVGGIFRLDDNWIGVGHACVTMKKVADTPDG